mmetsp:Transcript_127920/g.356004  ORF Transcript_127920/g.356004 Transcript_127920/m.356004 type:complete len:221 (+) Transcript_127920:62-724(+)
MSMASSCSLMTFCAWISARVMASTTRWPVRACPVSRLRTSSAPFSRQHTRARASSSGSATRPGRRSNSSGRINNSTSIAGAVAFLLRAPMHRNACSSSCRPTCTTRSALARCGHGWLCRKSKEKCTMVLTDTKFMLRKAAELASGCVRRQQSSRVTSARPAKHSTTSSCRLKFSSAHAAYSGRLSTDHAAAACARAMVGAPRPLPRRWAPPVTPHRRRLP